VLVLAYDQLVHFSQVRPPTSGRQSAHPVSAPTNMASAPTNMASAPTDMASAPTDKRPARTAPRTKKVELSEGEGSAKSFEHDTPADTLKRRCLEHFAANGIARDDCVRVIDQLRAENIADEIIDMALGQCENADARSLDYLVKVARAFYKQRTGQGPP
jgi:hypothetical protein